MDTSLKANANDYVVLLHGISRDATIMKKLEWFLEPLGYIPFNHSYPSMDFSVEELSQQIWKSIQEACPDKSKKIHFVVHSLGGLITRYILSHYSIPNLGRVIMIATPNHGTEVCDFMSRFSWYQKKFGPAGMEIMTGPSGIAAQLPQHVDYDLGIIAGNRTVDPWFTWFVLPSPGDGKVTIESTKLDGMRDHIIVPASHPHITNKAITAYQVAYYLKFGKFDHSK